MLVILLFVMLFFGPFVFLVGGSLLFWLVATFWPVLLVGGVLWVVFQVVRSRQ